MGTFEEKCKKYGFEGLTQLAKYVLHQELSNEQVNCLYSKMFRMVPNRPSSSITCSSSSDVDG